jgi:hypothetical protein
VLRAYYRDDQNDLLQGAFAGLTKRVKATPWIVGGPRSGTAKFQDMLRNSQFGQGWGALVSLATLDFLRHDIGAFVEVIGPGNPMRPMTGAVTGLAHLDTMRCWPTGDPEYPVLYVDRENKRHLLHNTRVLHFVDMPDGDERLPGPIGLCALSRAMAVVSREIKMGRYVEVELDDNPPPGIMLARNMSEQSKQAAAARFRQEQAGDIPPIWGRTIWFYSLQPENPIELESISFQKPPEGFDYKVYKVDIDIPSLALAIGVDPQELWPLSGQRMGTGTQSEILHAKGRGKAFADILKMWERGLNEILPPAYEFEFKFRDEQQDRQTAETAQIWVSTVQTMADLSSDERRRLIAKQVDAFHGVLTDEFGEVVALPDDDPKDPAQSEVLVSELEEMPANEQGTAKPESVANERAWFKAWNMTRAAFMARFVDAVSNALAGQYTRRQFGVILLDRLRAAARDAYFDGLEAGGVVRADFSAEDLQALNQWLKEQSQYVNSFARRVYDQGLSDAQVTLHANLWANKSLRGAYQLGEYSANRNGSYQWRLGDTDEHCRDCLRLNGQVHRLRDWMRKRWMPGSEKLECKGYNCDCQLVEVPGVKARGRF